MCIGVKGSNGLVSLVVDRQMIYEVKAAWPLHNSYFTLSTPWSHYGFQSIISKSIWVIWDQALFCSFIHLLLRWLQNLRAVKSFHA